MNSTSALEFARAQLPCSTASGGQPRVLYSFPHRIGAQRICATAWHQVEGAVRAGAKVTVLAGSLARNFPSRPTIHTTLSFGRWRLPCRLIGTRRLCRLHDLRTSRWLESHATQIDLVHGWPLASLRTIAAARRHDIPVVLERPNAHTRYAYRAVAEECQRLDLTLPKGSEHVHDSSILAHEEAEYRAADFLLCPSDFVARTFRAEGYAASKLLRHRYGFDPLRFFPETPSPSSEKGSGLTLLYAGVGHPRKGLHHALAAWRDSKAHERGGTFTVCGNFVPGYRERLGSLLRHPSVQVLGQHDDLGAVMRRSDVFVLPTVEEGSALVTYEARASGCVLAVSDAAGAPCEHRGDGLVHPVGDVAELTRHLALLDRDRGLLNRLRSASLAGTAALTWEAAGVALLAAYGQARRRQAR